MSNTKRIAAAGVGVALVLAPASPAFAAPTHHSRTLTVTGVVTAVQGKHVKVLASTAKAHGKVVARNQRLTLTFKAKARVRHTATSRTTTGTKGLTPGDVITATVTDDGTTLTTTSTPVTATPAPAEARIGTVASVSGSLITLASQDHVDGNACAHDDSSATVVDTSKATFSGPTTSAAGFQPGDSIVALGESHDHVMAAAEVFSFTGAPSVVSGRVDAADATAKSFSVSVHPGGHDQGDHQSGDDGQGEAQDHHQGGGDDGNDPTPPPASTDITVDASAATVVINGNHEDGATTTPATFPSVGDRVLVVGTEGTGGTTLTATVVFGFNHGDHAGVGHNDD